MESRVLQTLRYQLQARIRRLSSISWQLYHWQLKQLWGFLHSHEVFKALLQDLVQKHHLVKDDIKTLVDGKLPYNQIPTFDTEEEQAAASYYVIKRCVGQEVQNVGNSPEIIIGRTYAPGEKQFPEMIEMFDNLFVRGLYEYLDEQLDDQNLLSYLLIRYKQRCEWFTAKKLRDHFTEDTARGEKGLTADLYKYLFDAGLEFHIEPASPVGEIDLISEQVGDERLLIDAKVFKGDLNYIKKGFHQLYTYTVSYNQPYGHLVIFNVSEAPLHFTFQTSAGIASLNINGKTISFTTIDIGDRPSASKRGVLKAYSLKEQDLIAQISSRKDSDNKL